MTEKTDMESEASCEACRPEETSGADCFVINMESFSHEPNKDANQSPSITKSFSRKASQRAEKKLNGNATAAANERDSLVASSSLKALAGTLPTEKPVAVGPSGGHKVHHQIAITAAGSITTAAESRFALRRNSLKRPHLPWLLDPKRILFFFATLSSIGTILLIFFTLTTSKMNGEDSPIDAQT